MESPSKINDILGESVIEILQTLDIETKNHCIKVGNLAIELEYFLERKDHTLSSAGFVLDIGKKYLSKSILEDGKALNALERRIVDYHSYFSYEMLKQLNVSESICKVVLHHHFKIAPCFDGTLSCIDETILRDAELLKTLDIFCALTEDRPYRKAKTIKEAVEILESQQLNNNAVLFLRTKYRI